MTNEKRTERVSIFLTQTELRALCLAAEYAQLERRDFVRRIVLFSVRSVVASTFTPASCVLQVASVRYQHHVSKPRERMMSKNQEVQVAESEDRGLRANERAAAAAARAGSDDDDEDRGPGPPEGDGDNAQEKGSMMNRAMPAEREEQERRDREARSRAEQDQEPTPPPPDDADAELMESGVTLLDPTRTVRLVRRHPNRHRA